MNHSSHNVFNGNFAAAFISRIKKASKVEVLVIGSLQTRFRSKKREDQLRQLQIKMPGGCAINDKENEDLSLAIARELRSEIARDAENFHVHIGEEIFQRIKTRRSQWHQMDHRQSFYNAQFDGDLRTEDMMEDEGDEVLSPPVWVEFRKLSQVIFFTHKDPLMFGLEYLARGFPDVAHEYADLLASYKANVPY